MILGVISDTHIPDRCDDIPERVAKELSQTDLIIHAGDFTSLEYYKKLKAIKPMKAVVGNIDAPELYRVLKEKETFTLEKYKIGLIHGFGPPESVFENVKKIFNGTYDLVIFGHTHKPLCEKIGKTVYFNPGSPTDKIFTDVNSCGIIELGKTIKTKIVTL